MFITKKRIRSNRLELWPPYCRREHIAGEWPGHCSGQVIESEETWSAISYALRKGKRGLPGRCALFIQLKDKSSSKSCT